MRRERGFALLTVLWAAGLLALVGLNLERSARTAAERVSHLAARTHNRAVADGLVQEEIFKLLDASARKAIVEEGEQHLKTVSGMVSMTVTDEMGRIDINSANVTSLKEVLLEIGVTDVSALQIAKEIYYWHRPSKAVGINLEVKDLQYGPLEGMYLDIGELSLIPGISLELQKTLKNYFTVYGMKPFDIKYANSIVRNAMRSSFVETKFSDTDANQLQILRIVVNCATNDSKFHREAIVWFDIADDTRQEPYLILSWE